ncbi:DUF167 domain-containing protein [Candidatus Sumerlaeota bacterium]|nr:DUF167 domain-containing protein [Candidatus Sumerlaeota bacterium]
MLEFIQARRDGVLLRVRVHPTARQTGLKGRVGNMLKVDVAAKAEGGAANKELITYLARFLRIEKHRISILRGEKSRNKIILISDADINDLKEKFKKFSEEEK